MDFIIHIFSKSVLGKTRHCRIHTQSDQHADTHKSTHTSNHIWVNMQQSTHNRKMLI